MDAENIVTLSEIEKSYNAGGEQLYVLKRVSLTVNKGEYLAILGASGSGKSTLMNIIGCMDTSDSGQYLLDGVDVNTCNDAGLTALRNQKIGFIFQKYHLIPQYTVLQNVMLPLLIRGKTRTEAAKMVEEYIRMVGLWERISHKPNELSGGQQQRVAIGRALATRPALIMADEPTGNLDSKNSQEVLALLQTMSDRYQQTILMITHNKNHASAADRVFRMTDGVLQDLGVSPC